MSQKPSIPKGTRDFTPREMAQRNYIFDTIRSVFQLYGFQQIETPAMENLSTLLGKYGDEGDKLLYKILNSGDFLSAAQPEDLKDSLRLAGKIAERGLRYDLTVPLARFVVQNRHKIAFPFKRFQIQPVWRADRPQKGRYREFYQCDADVVGSNSLLNELELLQIIDEVYHRLKINVHIKLNNRKILSGIAEVIGEAENLINITVAIDKLDKIGLEKVNQELINKGVSQNAIDKLQPILKLSGDNKAKLEQLKVVLQDATIGMEGIHEIEEIFALCETVKLRAPISLDLTLARGLNYYTGAIIEVATTDMEMGSISGGGRYDNLTGMFGMPDVPGVGISFGADRIYDVLTHLNLFPEHQTDATKILFICLGAKEQMYVLPMLQTLREQGIQAELYTDNHKLKKQFTYADQKDIPYVGIVGEEEMQAGKIMLRNMGSGEQALSTIEEVIAALQAL